MLKLNLSIMIVVVLMIAIVEAVFGQDTLDLTKTTDAARLNVESGRISVSTAGTRVNGASMLYWLPTLEQWQGIVDAHAKLKEDK